MPEWLWWGIYTMVCIWLQSFFPGVDFFLPGLLVCLQEGKLWWAVWLGLICLIIQEGTGSLAFGTSLMWYAGLFVAFYAGKSLLESKNLLFILGFALVAGFWHWVTIFLMASLQNMQVMQEMLLKDSLFMVVGLPPMWGIVFLFYRRFVESSS
jgi:hypothetical protein